MHYITTGELNYFQQFISFSVSHKYEYMQCHLMQPIEKLSIVGDVFSPVKHQMTLLLIMLTNISKFEGQVVKMVRKMRRGQTVYGFA